MAQRVDGPQTRPSANGRGRPFGEVLDRNISTLVEMRKEAEARKPRQDRIADAITRFTGSMTFVSIHAVLFGAWIVVNLGWVPAVPRFDPSFVVLAMAASVEAIFLSTFVLISQNRMQAQDEKRAELDLQISLLAEHEVTQVVQVLDAVARHLGVAITDPGIEESKRDVDPSTVLEVIEERAEEQGTSPGT